jgi:protein ImuB
MTRLACLFVPMFPLAARLRSEPDLREEALVIVEGSGSHVHLIAAARRARKMGIRAGMTLVQARSILPKLVARPRDLACEQTAQEALLEVAETFSPRIEDAGNGVVFIDVTGMERHFNSPEETGQGSPEERLARAAIRAMDAAGLPGRAGIAASKLAARVAAELPKSPVVVAAGDEAAFLAPLPLGRLTPEIEAAAMLRRFGLTSIGELAGLSESEIASRLGEIGRGLHRAARGIDPEPLIPRPLPPEFREAMEIEWPLVALEPFLFVAHAALERLTGRMERQGFAAKRIEMTLTLEPDGYDARGIDLPAPTRDVKTLLTLLRLDLERRPPGAPVAGFALTAIPDRPRRAQLSLFGPTAVSPEKLATTIARLVSMLGDGRVGMPVTVDGHLPERHGITDFDPPPPPTRRVTPPAGRGVVAVRVFRPPVPVEVIHDGSRITSLQGDGIAGTVRATSGPWYIEEGWWRGSPASREYFDVEVYGEGVYRMYRERVDAQWVVDARYGV